MTASKMILLFTDFGLDGPYTGQMLRVLAQLAPGVATSNLVADAPAFRPLESGYLLAALRDQQTAAGDVFLCVVDPGVGGDRHAVVLQADGQWFVGPDNGLLDAVAARSARTAWWQITWRPESFSASFHGRDIFAPIAARLATGISPATAGCIPLERGPLKTPADLCRVIYIDHYGNAMTGIRADTIAVDCSIELAGELIRPAGTFSDAAPGDAFWYANSLGLVEIAVNQGQAAARMSLSVGDSIVVREQDARC